MNAIWRVAAILFKVHEFAMKSGDASMNFGQRGAANWDSVRHGICTRPGGADDASDRRRKPF